MRDVARLTVAALALLAVVLAPLEIVWSDPVPLPFASLRDMPDLRQNPGFDVCPGVDALDGVVAGELWRLLVAPSTGRFFLIKMDAVGPNHEEIRIEPAYGWAGRLGSPPDRVLIVEREGPFLAYDSKETGMWGDSPCPALLGRRGGGPEA